MANAYTPYFPPITPYVLPRENFDNMIQAYGIQLAWAKAHSCPCVFGNLEVQGTPDSGCKTCFGRGVYWDGLSTPFTGLITFIHQTQTPDEPGSMASEQQGIILRAEPTVTIPFMGPGTTNATVWAQCSLYDMIVETQAISRFNATLQVGRQQTLPFVQRVTVAPSGAVTVYDPVNHVVVPVSGYVVSGSTVTISGYPIDTSYTVEFSAAPAYIAYHRSGAPAHTRPFGAIQEPVRFRMQQLDLWTRSRGAGDIPSI